MPPDSSGKAKLSPSSIVNTRPASPQTMRSGFSVVPTFRLDTGMHTAKITSISVDTAERYLVTGSNDKTVRVWSLPKGQLLRVLRPPIGDNDEGKVYAVAISPDGKMVAVGGWTGYQWEREISIYLFHRATGELRQRLLTKQSGAIHHLAYSPDGRYLVASLGAKNGIRLYQTSNYHQLAEDTDYGDDSYWAEFDNTGRLVTTCFDGHIRLYDEHLKLLVKRKATNGNRPFAASFSPTGNKIAVGFLDSAQINVLSADDLISQYMPDTQNREKGSLPFVAWSQNGQWLYAGGIHDANTGPSILRWSQAGQGNYQTWRVAANTITGIRALQTGKLAFGGNDPIWGVLDATGQIILEHQTSIVDFRDKFQGDLLLSKEGDTVQFGYKKAGSKRTVRFSMKERTLTPSPPPQPNLTAPRLNASDFNLSGWNNTTQPKLNGNLLFLEQNETAHSLAITPDEQHFLLGTNWFLRFFDKRGNQRWEVRVSGAVWSVNIANNGKIAVATLGDGTLRWYRLYDGRELLVLFPHRDEKRWILWTPQDGYYAASPGTEEFIGWHVNKSKEQAADFFSADLFASLRDRYYQPKAVTRVLDALDQAGGLVQSQTLQQQLPPVVTILSPPDDATFSNPNIELRYRIRTSSNELLTDIKTEVLIDGRRADTRGLHRINETETEFSKQLTLPPRDVNVSLIAKNSYAVSEPVTIRLRWQGPQQLPKLYVLAVGVSNYDDKKIRQLKYAAKDAQDFVQLLKKQKQRGLYRGVSVTLLSDARTADILDGLAWIERETTQNDVAMVFFSGHGINGDDKRYYFLPRDADLNRPRSTAIRHNDIKETVTTIKGKALFFTDTCHAGNVMGIRHPTANINPPDIDQIVNDLTRAENGVVVFASSTGTQLSREDPSWQNGAFTEALLEGLSGRADYNDKDGAISIEELGVYLSYRVKQLTHGAQTPTTTKPEMIPDFPVVIY